jgi:hypothetical protein
MVLYCVHLFCLCVMCFFWQVSCPTVVWQNLWTYKMICMYVCMCVCMHVCMYVQHSSFATDHCTCVSSAVKAKQFHCSKIWTSMHSGKRLRHGFLGYELLLLLIHTSSTMHKFGEKSGEINAVYIDVIKNWLCTWWQNFVLNSRCKCLKDVTVHIGLFLVLNNNYLCQIRK